MENVDHLFLAIVFAIPVILMTYLAICEYRETKAFRKRNANKYNR